MPMNVASGKSYRGVNVPILWSTCQERGYGSPIFGTYQQWQDKKAQVCKGEKSATAVFSKFSDGKKEGEDGNEEETDAHRRQWRALT
jgi:antirestriction protein ArdC